MTAAVVLLVLVSAIFSSGAVLALFIPLALNYLWLFIVEKIPPLKPFYPTGMALNLSLATLWLYSVVAPRRHPIIRIITALIIFALFGIATYYSIAIYMRGYILFPEYFLLSIPIIGGLVFSGIRCRKRFTNRYFILSLLIGIFIFNLLSTAVVIIYFVKYIGFPLETNYMLIFLIFRESLLTTAFSYLLILPYIFITFRNTLFRTAMMSVFGLTKNTAINDDLKNECERR